MLIRGLWLLCDDGVERPVIHGEALAGDGSRVRVPFLVDPAADRTVFSADILEALGLERASHGQQLGGVGGIAASVVVDTQIEFAREQPGPAVFRGRFAAFTNPEALDMSVLGRDITNLLAVIVDRPGEFVCLLGQRHSHSIVPG
jgi:hypothetical protein